MDKVTHPFLAPEGDQHGHCTLCGLLDFDHPSPVKWASDFAAACGDGQRTRVSVHPAVLVALTTRLHAAEAELAALREHDAFIVHLKRASSIVAGWPDWKRRLLGRVEASELDALRRVVRVASAALESEDSGWDEVRDALRPGGLRAAGDEPGAAAVEAALKGGA